MRRSNRSRIDVTAPKRRGRGIPGIEVHSAAMLRPEDVEDVDGIACTMLARTLLDLAEVLSRQQVERAIDEADRLERFDLKAVRQQLERANGRRGATMLHSILDDRFREPALTRNKLEQAFLALCRGASLPQPRVNAWIALEPTGVEADFLWRDQRLIAEVDGNESHGTRRAFEDDRRRDQRLMLLGYRVVRFTWRQVTEDPATTAATVRSLLARHAG